MKNPDIKNLRVAVIPSETGNGITQSSTVEEILACEDLQLYPLTDYFQAQNNEDIDLLHWSFLIDIETKTDWTGANINGIHQDDKKAKIHRIKSIIAEYGGTSSFELELDASPCMNSIGNNRGNICQLVEHFYSDYVTAVTYDDDVEISEDNYDYEELSDELIDEIYEIVVKYEKDCIDNEE